MNRSGATRAMRNSSGVFWNNSKNREGVDEAHRRDAIQTSLIFRYRLWKKIFDSITRTGRRTDPCQETNLGVLYYECIVDHEQETAWKTNWGWWFFSSSQKISRKKSNLDHRDYDLKNQLFEFFREAHVKVYKILHISCPGNFPQKSFYRGYPSHLKSRSEN